MLAVTSPIVKFETFWYDFVFG